MNPNPDGDRPGPTLVVCMKGHRDDDEWLAGVVYVGRAQHQGGWRLPASSFANPFHARDVGGPLAAARLYTGWIAREDDLLARIATDLRGRRLGCWCLQEDPEDLQATRREPACHAVILAMLADGWPVDRERHETALKVCGLLYAQAGRPAHPAEGGDAGAWAAFIAQAAQVVACLGLDGKPITTAEQRAKAAKAEARA